MKAKLLEIFKNGCDYLFCMDVEKITDDLQISQFMDEFDLADMLMYMEENLEKEIAMDIKEEYVYMTIEQFVETVCTYLE